MKCHPELPISFLLSSLSFFSIVILSFCHPVILSFCHSVILSLFSLLFCSFCRTSLVKIMPASTADQRFTTFVDFRAQLSNWQYRSISPTEYTSQTNRASLSIASRLTVHSISAPQKSEGVY